MRQAASFALAVLRCKPSELAFQVTGGRIFSPQSRVICTTTSCAAGRSPAGSESQQSVQEEGRPPVKATLLAALKQAAKPLTAEELWRVTESVVTSKKFMKRMLMQLKKAGKVKTKPNVLGKSFGYTLNTQLREDRVAQQP